MKCLIVKHTLGRRSWYLVQQGALTLSTPLDTFEQATEWIKSMAGVQRLGCYRISDDLTEVHFQESTSQPEPEWCFDRSTGLMGFKKGEESKNDTN